MDEMHWMNGWLAYVLGYLKSISPYYVYVCIHLPAISSLEPRVAVTSMDNSVRIVNISSMKEDWELRSLCVPTAASIRRRAAASEDNATSSIAQTVMNLKSNKGFIPSDIAYRCQVSGKLRSYLVWCCSYLVMLVRI
jgi:hypothetical protein